jgi:hypothetical protein
LNATADGYLHPAKIEGPDPTITGERPGQATSIIPARSPSNREPCRDFPRYRCQGIT